MSTMTAPEPQADNSSVLGTLGWVGVVIVGALLALLLLSWLGPVGGQ
jgi:hypothetical protein